MPSDEYIKQQNEYIKQQISELTKGQARTEALLGCIPSLKESISNVRSDIATLTAEVHSLHETCPFREDIARGQNNIDRVDNLEKEVKALNDKQHDDRLVTTKGLAKIALVVAAAGMVGANVNLGGLLGLFN